MLDAAYTIPKSPSSTRSVDHWAVVGGGMLGLATAWKLASRGERVTLFEAGRRLGGLTSSWSLSDGSLSDGSLSDGSLSDGSLSDGSLGDVQWDRFYHVILRSDTRLRAMLAEIGLESEIRWVQTQTGFYSDGQLYSLSSSLDFLFFPPLSLWQKFRLGTTIFYASKLRYSHKLEQITVDHWLRTLSGRSTFEKIWLPLLKAKLGDAYQRTSAAFIWSYIDRMYKARRSGMKREMFGYIPGGYRRIVETLANALTDRGVEIVTSAPVAQVASVTSGEQNHGTGLRIESGSGQQLDSSEFDRVVMTVPSPIISQACPELNDDERFRLTDAEYLGVVCTSLLLDRPLGGYYVTNIIDDWVPLTGIIEMGAIVDPDQLGGHYLVYLPQYLRSDDPRFEESDKTIHQRCLETLERMYPDFKPSRVSAMRTARARHVMTLPTLDYSRRLPPVVSSIPGLYLMNSAQITVGNLNVNEIVEIVEREFARSIWRDAGRGD